MIKYNIIIKTITNIETKGENMLLFNQIMGLQEPVKKSRGKNLITFPCDYTVIDLETTGLSSETDQIIELSAVKIRNNKVTGEFTSFVKPTLKLDPYITQLTGINQEMLENAPKISDVISKFLDFMGADIIIGHNVKFDLGFLYEQVDKTPGLELPNDFVDTVKLSKKYLTLPNHKLETVAKHYNISTQGHHRALNDCHMTHSIYQKMKDMVLGNLNQNSPI